MADNPYRPGAAHAPPYLAGRRAERQEFSRLLGQTTVLENLILTGIRGIGKTVLMREALRKDAIENGWLWASSDISEAVSVSEDRLAQRLLTDLNTFSGGWEYAARDRRPAGFDNTPERQITHFDYNTMVALYEHTPGLTSDKIKQVLLIAWELMQKHLPNKKGIIFAWDEAQNLADRSEGKQYPLGVLLDVFSSLQSQGVPFMLLLSGLPTLLSKLVESRAYAGRMFHVMMLENLSPEDSRTAIMEPLTEEQDSWMNTVFSLMTKEIYKFTHGYPYFIQFWCRELYDFVSNVDPGKEEEIQPINERITHKLDMNFFEGRWARLTDRQRDLLTIIAKLENSGGEFAVQEIVEESKSTDQSFSNSHAHQMLTALFNKGMVFKNRHGKYLLAVPLLDQFILRRTAREAKMNAKPIKVFITYAHTDTKYRKELKTQLGVMEQNRDITVWADNEILAGDKWRDEIDKNISECDMLLYLTSAYSLASKNCNKELTDVLKKNNIRVIPIILDHCDWAYHKLSRIQSIPSDNGNVKPVRDWRPRTKAWQTIVNELRKTVNELKKQETDKVIRSPEAKKKAAAMQFFQTGNIAAFLGQHESAISIYDKVIKLNPQFAEAYNNRGIIKNNLSDHEGAITDYDNAIKLNPLYDGAYCNRGNTKNVLGNRQGAMADYDKAIKINPQLAEAYNNRGIVKSNLGNRQGAIADYDKAIKINPFLAGAYNNRGNAKYNLGDLQGAMANYNKAIEIDPKFVEAYCDRGAAKSDLGKYQEAIADYNKAIKINPLFANAYCNRGTTKSDFGKYQEAIVDYDKAIKINPLFANAYYNRGAAKNNLGKYQEAIADYDKAIKINPLYADAYNNRGVAKSKLRDHQRSMADYDKAIELNPLCADAYFNRGTTKYITQKYQKAINDLDQSIQLDPKNANSHYLRGLAKSKLANRTARKDLERAIVLAKEQGLIELAQRIQQALDDLDKRQK